jgi:hypothetical protein
MSSPLQLQPCSDIAPAPIEWLWEPYLARGKLAILDGDHGTGKSLVAADLAARLSVGGPFPNGPKPDGPATTLLLNGEGDPAGTARLRFEAAGADLSRIIVASSGAAGPPQLPDCVPELKRAIEQSSAKLLILDPLSAFVPPGWATSDHRMRQALAPLSAAAAETGCAVLLVRCLGKNVGANAVYRGGGSAGALRLALTGMLLAPHRRNRA